MKTKFEKITYHKYEIENKMKFYKREKKKIKNQNDKDQSRNLNK